MAMMMEMALLGEILVDMDMVLAMESGVNMMAGLVLEIDSGEDTNGGHLPPL